MNDLVSQALSQLPPNDPVPVLAEVAARQMKPLADDGLIEAATGLARPDDDATNQARESTVGQASLTCKPDSETPRLGLSDSRGGETLSRAGNGEQGEPATGHVVAPHETPGSTSPLGSILDKIEKLISNYVSFPKANHLPVVALWVVHTWLFDRFRYTPYLHIFSPEKRCGKSILLDSLALVVFRPWKIDNLSEAALFHKASKQQPTMLWDEVDNVFVNERDNAPIIGLLNAGFKRGGKAVRVPRGNLEEYDVFCPKALCGIGRIPDTTHDRCIDIKLARARGKHVFREEDAEPAGAVIRSELVAWSRSLGKDAHKVAVSFPAEYRDNGRKCDITEPLLIIAHLAGPDWLEKAEHALGDICSHVDDYSVGIQLLGDVRKIFTDFKTDKLFTHTMLEALVKIEDAKSPWPVWWEGDLKFGKTRGPAKKLANYLKEYDIEPRSMRNGNETAKGYMKRDFEDVWNRYLPPEDPLGDPELDL